MSSPSPPPPVRSGPLVRLLPTLTSLLRRLRHHPAAVAAGRSTGAGVDPLHEVGRRLRAAREARGLTLRQLGQQTRVSITVLEALEKGWRDRLPEAAYLRSILGLLEQHLSLDPGSLEAALPPRRLRGSRSAADPRQRSVSLTSIELFTTWQGTAVYALLCLLLLYGLNREQQRLAARGMLSLRPLPPQPSGSQAGGASSDSRASARILQAYPELRPLEHARHGLALRRLKLEAQSPALNTPAAPKPASAAASAEPRPTPQSGAASSAGSAGRGPAAAAQDAETPARRP